MAAPTVQKYSNPIMRYRAKWNPHIHVPVPEDDPCGLGISPQLTLDATVQSFRFAPTIPQRYSDPPLAWDSSYVNVTNQLGEKVRPPLVPMIETSSEMKRDNVKKPKTDLMEISEDTFGHEMSQMDYKLPIPQLKRQEHRVDPKAKSLKEQAQRYEAEERTVRLQKIARESILSEKRILSKAVKQS